MNYPPMWDEIQQESLKMRNAIGCAIASYTWENFLSSVHTAREFLLGCYTADTLVGMVLNNRTTRRGDMLCGGLGGMQRHAEIVARHSGIWDVLSFGKDPDLVLRGRVDGRDRIYVIEIKSSQNTTNGTAAKPVAMKYHQYAEHCRRVFPGVPVITVLCGLSGPVDTRKRQFKQGQCVFDLQMNGLRSWYFLSGVPRFHIQYSEGLQGCLMSMDLEKILRNKQAELVKLMKDKGLVDSNGVVLSGRLAEAALGTSSSQKPWEWEFGSPPEKLKPRPFEMLPNGSKTSGPTPIPFGKVSSSTQDEVDLIQELFGETT